MNDATGLGQLLREVEELARRLLPKREKAPPGMEPVVKALKGKPGVDNPYAVAWAMHGESNRPAVREAATVTASDDKAHTLDVILITEGLGNLRDKNFYSAEAIASAVEVFNGEPCFINHPTATEDKELPERNVWAKCGYYFDLREEKVTDPKTGKTVSACCGKLRLDASESGKTAFQKALTAIEHRKQFPDKPVEYVGISVNADEAAGEKRTIDIDGAPMEVNYITRFIKVRSADLVTEPARGGCIVGVLEDVHGKRTTKEAHMKKVREAIASALAALKESKPAEAEKVLKSIEAEAESETAMYAKREGEDEAGHKLRLAKHLEALKSALAPYGQHAEPDGDEKPEPAAPAAPEHKKDMESSRLAVKHLVQESGIPADAYNDSDVERMATMPLREARAKIDGDKRLIEAALKRFHEPVASFHSAARESFAGKSATEAFAAAAEEAR